MIDTNILVSALLSPAGNEAELLRRIDMGEIQPCLSDDILTEYRGVLARAKFARVHPYMSDLIDTVVRRGIRIEPTRAAISSPDPNDQPFLECAISGGAEFIVTGNRRDFPDAFYGRAEVLNAREMLGRLSQIP